VEGYFLIHGKALLTPVFPAVHVDALLRHFAGMTEDFQKGDWEDSIAKAGKFVEAVLKALSVRCGDLPAKGKHFKVDKVINDLAQKPPGSVDDVIRLTIPRACRFVYDVASNRGGRHDPDEIDPNELDATAVVNQCSWIVGEMIRHAQHGKASTREAKDAVEGLVRRRYPLLEDIDGHTYFHADKPSAPEVALVILARAYPRRMGLSELIAQLRSNKFEDKNARTAIGRINRYVHEDADGKLVLLGPGLKKAEEIMQAAALKDAK